MRQRAHVMCAGHESTRRASREANLRLAATAAAFPLGEVQGGSQWSSSASTSSSSSPSESEGMLKQIPSGESSHEREGPALVEGEKGAASGLSCRPESGSGPGGGGENSSSREESNGGEGRPGRGRWAPGPGWPPAEGDGGHRQGWRLVGSPHSPVSGLPFSTL